MKNEKTNKDSLCYFLMFFFFQEFLHRSVRKLRQNCFANFLNDFYKSSSKVFTTKILQVLFYALLRKFLQGIFQDSLANFSNDFLINSSQHILFWFLQPLQQWILSASFQKLLQGFSQELLHQQFPKDSYTNSSKKSFSNSHVFYQKLHQRLNPEFILLFFQKNPTKIPLGISSRNIFLYTCNIFLTIPSCIHWNISSSTQSVLEPFQILLQWFQQKCLQGFHQKFPKRFLQQVLWEIVQ